MKACITILLMACCQLVTAQEIPGNTQEQLENLVASGEDASIDEDLALQLEQFSKNKLDLNTASAEELQLLRILTDLQISQLLSYRQLLGDLIDIHELQAVPCWDPVTIRKLLPYVRTGKHENVRDFVKERWKGEHHVLLRISGKDKNDNATTELYPGSNWQALFRYRYQYKNSFYMGITGEKDAGEQFMKGAQKQGFDFYSFHLFARKHGLVKSLAIGDYTVSLGQGLIHWQGMGFGKSSEVMSIKRQSAILLPYRSSGEFYFSRGAGVTLAHGKFELTCFGSYRKLGAYVQGEPDSLFTSFYTSGYYRSPSEINKKNKVALFSWGGNISYSLLHGKVGINWVHHQFSLPLEKDTEPYNIYMIRGRQWKNLSMDYSYTIRNVHLFGEAAVDGKGNMGMLAGGLISVDKKADLSILYRNLGKAYQSLWGSAFTENSLPSNENGLYLGCMLQPLYGWSIRAYADFYRMPWLRFRVHGMQQGADYLVQLVYTPDKKTELYLRYRQERKPANLDGAHIDFPELQVKRNLRLHCSKILDASFSLRMRVELSYLEKSKRQEGFLGFIEAHWVAGSRLKLNGRLQMYETSGYESRLYVYEQDVMYSFSLPAYFGKGIHYYINVRYEPLAHLTCWGRWARTVDRSPEGEPGGAQNNFRLQIIYTF